MRIMKQLLAAFLSLLASTACATDFYVSPTGIDSNPGTREKPFATLERARDGARAVHKPGQGKDTIHVWLRGGSYIRTKTLEFGKLDAGTTTAPLVISAYGNEIVRITGGVVIPPSAFHTIRNAPALRRLPPSSRDHVVEVDLKALGITDFGKHRQFGHGLPVVSAPMEVCWNDTMLQLAHYPNEGAILMGPVIDPGSVPRVGDYRELGGRFSYSDPRHSRWADATDIWLQGYFHYGFADDKIRVAHIDTSRKEITLASPHMYGLGSGENFNQYVALNLLEELDAPGEWYADPNSGLLLLWPPGELSDARIVVSVMEEPLIAIEEASEVVLKNLIIENGRGLGIYLEGGSHNSIIGCTIRNIGTMGIMLGQGARQTFPHITADDYTGIPVSREVGTYHAHNYRNTAWERNAGIGHIIERCEVSNTGSGGILLGGGSKKSLIPGGCTVSDCRIHEFTRRNKAGAAGVIVDGCGNRVVHNEIYDGDLQAIIVHGNEHLFEFNRIHHVARNSNDASAWYLGRDPSDQGNTVRWNFFYDVGRPDRKWTMGVYCDDATCGVTIEGNVFYRVASYGTVYSNGGHDIVVRNNIFIEGYGPAYQLKSMWYDFGYFERDYFFGEHGAYTTRLTRSIDIRKPPYSTRYPRLADWLDLLEDGSTYVGMRPRRNIVDRNVLVKFEETFRLVGKYAQTEFGENFLTNDDPGFVNAKAMDFRLKPDAELYKKLPGFEPIPFEQIGPRD
jgi:parallel beta-helix repeat protein